ncbi:Long-chain-fatty-acid--CoA ligase 4 [Halotydeus destructor]|nr:Long-chain-fatty-acid--CoA ligase 4 [Halotydeus destructor]
MATLYATLGNDGIVNSLNELETATIVSSNGLLPKLKSILAQCPGLTNLVLVRDQVGGVYTSTPTDLGDGVHVFLYDQLRQSAVPEADADPRHSLNQPSDIACVMYTSGSTGVPKGVQLSHTNIMSCLRAVNVIIDRRKDLVKLQNGEFISLGKIESELKGSPLVENICVVADPNQTSCVALVIPNKSALKRLVTKHNLPVGDDLYHPSVNDVALKEIVEYANQTKLRRLEIPKRIKLCKEEWTPSNNLVTAALKIKRKEIQKFYTKDIAELYA